MFVGKVHIRWHDARTPPPGREKNASFATGPLPPCSLLFPREELFSQSLGWRCVCVVACEHEPIPGASSLLPANRIDT